MSSYQKIQIPDKLKRERVSPETNVPNDFLLLLDELKLDRKDAQKFYENKEEWSFVKSDRKIYCTVKGKNKNHFKKSIIAKVAFF